MVMSRLETILCASQFNDVAALLEGLDGPLAEQPENAQLWLYLVLGHLYNHQCEYARFAMNRAPVIVYESNEFKAACELVKIVWNREYALAWRILGSDVWTASLKPFVDAVALSLRARVVADISQAYSSISMKRACDLLGMEAEALLADCENNKNWRVDRQSGLLRIAQDVTGTHEECDLSELQSITEQMIALS